MRRLRGLRRTRCCGSGICGVTSMRAMRRGGAQVLESKIKGAEVFIIANAETVMTRGSALMADVFPRVEVRKELGGMRRCCRLRGGGGCWGMSRRLRGRIGKIGQ